MANQIAVVIVGFSLIASAQAASEARPFWKIKPRAYERIQNGEVLVTVKSESSGLSPLSRRLVLAGGGQTSVSRSFAFSEAQKYENLPRASGGYVKTVEYQAELRHLTLKIEAFRYSTKVVVEVEPVVAVEPWQLRYKVIDGPLRGLEGAVTFAELKADRCEVGIEGHLLYEKFPIPRLFLEFGMEAMLKHMALRLRSFLEAEQRKAQRAV